MPEADWARPIVHFEIQGRDRKLLQDFYASLFNWTIDDNNPIQYGRIEHGVGGPPEGVGGGIMQSDQPRVLVYVQVRDLSETLRRVEELGGRQVLQPIDTPGGPTIAQMADPEGNLIGLIQQ